MKRRLALIITLVLVMSISALVGLRSSRSGLAASYSARAECSGNPLSVTVTAPTSVVAGATFSVTGASSTSTAPQGITIQKIVSTTSLANATPAVNSATWTGNGTGTFTALFPDLNLVASGPAGSQVKMSLSRIDLYISGSSSPITCSLANGQLTAAMPGESLTVFSANITAPAPRPSSGGGSPAPTTPNPTPVSGATTKAAPATGTPAAPASTPASPAGGAAAAASDTGQSQAVSSILTIYVKDSQDQAVTDAQVKLDSNITVTTGSDGSATFASVPVGSHKITVVANKKTLVRSITLDGKSSAPSFTVQLAGRKSPALAVSGAAAALLVVTLAYLGLKHWRSRRIQAVDLQAASYAAPAVTPTGNIVVGGAPAETAYPTAAVPAPPQPESQPIAPVQPPFQPDQTVQPTVPAPPLAEQATQPAANQPEPPASNTPA